jgi:hypothetical protein
MPEKKPAKAEKLRGRPGVEAWLDGVEPPALRDVARRLDALVLDAMPDAVCDMKWNVPFYGRRGQGWVASLGAFKAHVKLLFFDGGDLDPKPPQGKGRNAVDFRSAADLDEHEEQVRAWLEQAKELPGWLRV